MASSNKKYGNIIIFGESGVGKTCFTDMFVRNERFAKYDPMGETTSRREMNVDGEAWVIDLLDVNASLFRDHDPALSLYVFKRWIELANGVVLLYDITNRATFDLITSEGYLNIVRNKKRLYGDDESTRIARFGCVLVGNKLDLTEEKREVDRDLAQNWADSQDISFFEVSTQDQGPIEDVIKTLARSIKVAMRLNEEDETQYAKVENKNQKTR